MHEGSIDRDQSSVDSEVHITLKRMLDAFKYMLLLCIASLIVGCDAMCENEPISSTPSPDGSKKAVVFIRACGATTGVSTQLSIISGGRSSESGSGNILVVEGRSGFQVSWETSSEIAVSNIGPGRIFKQEVKLDETAVRYAYSP